MHFFTIWKNCTVGKNYFGELFDMPSVGTGITLGNSYKAAISKMQIGYVGTF